MQDAFDEMNETYRKSFRDFGGEYIPRDEHEKTCVVRVPPTVFFKVLTGIDVCLYRERLGQ